MGLLVGQKAPEFNATAVIDQEFRNVKLEDYLDKYIILFFYPLDFTFVCPTEIKAFNDRYEEFQNLNTEILGVSVDSEFAHLAWIQTDPKEGGIGDLQYPLISDLNKTISKDYEILEPNAGVALRGLYIIDPQGIIQYITINNLSVGRSIDETLRILKAIQYVDSHENEVCPVNWQEGDKTMNADPVQAKNYFAS